jgi:hypothetical protein
MDSIDKNTFFSYIAGYIDGDGCFYIGKPSGDRTRYQAKIIITSVNQEVLHWISTTFRGSIQYKVPQKTTHKPVYYLNISPKASLLLSENTLPYLVEKSDEAKLFIDFARSKKENKKAAAEEMNKIKNFNNLVSKNHKEEFELLRATIKPTKEDFAYLAGFIDAECCLGIQKYKSKHRSNPLYKIQLQCNNTKAPIFKWLLQRFGGQIHFIDRNTRNPDHRNQLTWRLSSKALSNILKDIHPFLRYKKPVCEELINFTNITLANGGARHTDIFRKSYSEILKQREEIVRKIHLLNLKGINV